MPVRLITLKTVIATAAITLGGCNDNPVLTEAPALTGLAGGVGRGGKCRGDDGTRLPTASRRVRVDLHKPAFSNPTTVTNPLFPIGQLSRVLLLGTIDGFAFRTETTLLPGTRTIDLRPRPVETLVSQYFALLGGRIHEVALDFYAQDDDGAVWYFGEDVFNYEAGVIADTDGTWLAGRDGPFAMIMPANPKVGDVWRPENICGFVFEEVIAMSTGVTVTGPRGAVQGALIVKELHMDGTFEDKIFAPGYGEFSTGSGGNLEAVALAVPIDAIPGPVPAALETITDGAATIFDAAQAGQWGTASAALGTMTAAWAGFQAGGVPPMLDAQMSGFLTALGAAVSANATAAARQGAINVARASLDLQLRHRPWAEIDLDNLDLWAKQILVDAAAGDQGALLGDIATIGWIRDRLTGITIADLRPIDAGLRSLRAAVGTGDPTATTAAALRLARALGDR